MAGLLKAAWATVEGSVGPTCCVTRNLGASLARMVHTSFSDSQTGGDWLGLSSTWLALTGSAELAYRLHPGLESAPLVSQPPKDGKGTPPTLMGILLKPWGERPP